MIILNISWFKNIIILYCIIFIWFIYFYIINNSNHIININILNKKFFTRW